MDVVLHSFSDSEIKEICRSRKSISTYDLASPTGVLSLEFVPVVVYREEPLSVWNEMDVSKNDFEVQICRTFFGANNSSSPNFESSFVFSAY
jgi:hypothetical protein